MRNPLTSKVDTYSARKPYLSINEDFIGAGENSSYRWKLGTFVRPEYLRVLVDNVSVVCDYQELRFSPRPAIDCHRAMMVHGKGNIQRRIRAMYQYTSVAIAPLELFMSHHFFVPVYQSCTQVSVQISRPTRAFENKNYIASAGHDILFCVSVLR